MKVLTDTNKEIKRLKDQLKVIDNRINNGVNWEEEYEQLKKYRNIAVRILELQKTL